MRIWRSVMGYSTRDHGCNPADAAVNYEVPFIGQNHGNLCGDACGAMLLRWAGYVESGEKNMRIFAMEGNCEEFLKAVEKYRKLPRDKFRDRAIEIFEQFCLPDSPNSILAACNINPDQDTFYLNLCRKISSCVANKNLRRAKYGGSPLNLSLRWERHKTKEEGYVVDDTLFDVIFGYITDYFYNGNFEGELRKNPRWHPFSGLTYQRLRKLPAWRYLTPTSIPNKVILYNRLYNNGPIIAATNFSNHRLFGKPILHAIIIKGYAKVSGTLIYHDPWRGQNMALDVDHFMTNKVGYDIQIKNLTPLMFNRVTYRVEAHDQ